jgi:hypothetical protein
MEFVLKKKYDYIHEHNSANHQVPDCACVSRHTQLHMLSPSLPVAELKLSTKVEIFQPLTLFHDTHSPLTQLFSWSLEIMVVERNITSICQGIVYFRVLKD